MTSQCFTRLPKHWKLFLSFVFNKNPSFMTEWLNVPRSRSGGRKITSRVTISRPQSPTNSSLNHPRVKKMPHEQPTIIHEWLATSEWLEAANGAFFSLVDDWGSCEWVIEVERLSRVRCFPAGTTRLRHIFILSLNSDFLSRKTVLKTILKHTFILFLP